MIEEIKKILIGIDQTELENPEGWWETSTGAEFGANKLKQIAEALAQPEQDWRALVLNHNADCDARCDMDRCGYKPYYEYNGRRCPDCPVYDKIEAAHGIKGEA